jgi:hypothetical protein
MECDLDLGGDGEPIGDYEVRLGVSYEALSCTECSRPIESGVEHEIVTGDLYDDTCEFHTCMDCVHIAEGLQTNGRDHGMLWGQLEEYGGEDGGGGFEHFNSGCMARVKTSSAKAYVLARYQKWKGLDPLQGQEGAVEKSQSEQAEKPGEAKP